MNFKSFLKTIFIFGMFMVSAIALAESPVYVKNTKTIKTDSVKNISTQTEFKQTLRRGMKNSDVLVLQKKLQEKGFYTKALDADYGSGTFAAVKAYQKSVGLNSDGIAGPQTFAKLLGTYKNKNTLSSVKSLTTDSFCNDVYEPVCAQLEVQCVKAPCQQPKPFTISNSCYAERKGAKVLYKGECEYTKPIEDKSCTKEYQPVCGIEKKTKCDYNSYGKKECKTIYGDIKTFNNKCEMYAANFEFKYFGSCDASNSVEKVKPNVVDLEAQIKELEKKIKELRIQLEKTQ